VDHAEDFNDHSDSLWMTWFNKGLRRPNSNPQ